VPNPKLKFMEQCREVMRFDRLALRTEEAYLQWIKRFIFFHGKRHPKDMGEPEVEAMVAARKGRRAWSDASTGWKPVPQISACRPQGSARTE